MAKNYNSFRVALLTSCAITVALSAEAAEVTSERLLNPDKEPQNWLMNHRTYDGQRFSLSRINKDNVKNLRLAYAVPLGGDSRQASSTRRPHLPRTASSTSLIPGVCSTRSTSRRATAGASSGAWTPSKSGSKPTAVQPSGATWSSRRPTRPARVIATDKETGKVVWETNVTSGLAQMGNTGAPLAVKDKIVVRSAGSDPAGAAGSLRLMPQPADANG